MALPVTIPNTFANATASIPLSQLDTNFTTLANAVNGISDGSETLANASVTVLTAGTVDINGGTIDGTAIGGSTAAAGSFTTLNTSGQVVFNDAGANVDFRVEGDTNANLLFVDASADAVGIGTSNPDAVLKVTHTIDSPTAIFENARAASNGTDSAVVRIISQNRFSNLYITAAPTRSSNINFGDSDDDDIGSIVYDHSDNALKITTNTSERMRIDSSGNLLVGTTSLNASGRLFNVKGNIVLGSFYRNTSTTNDSVIEVRSDVGGTNIVKFQVDADGDVFNTNNSYGAISDVKLKQDIVDAGSQWDDLKAIRIRKFRFKNDPEGVLQIGVIAQELEEVSPGLVSENPDYEEVEVPVLDDEGNPVLDDEGNPTTRQEQQATGETTKSVKATVLYMKAVKALQEAMERIETLEAKVAALEAK